MATSYFHPNTIYCGDCKDVLRKFPNEYVDLIYLDPPFFSNKKYEVIWGDGYEIRAFEDRWKGGVEHYILWMNERLEQCYRVLKNTGSLYLHCDYHADAHLRIALDKIFGDINFRNEIIWERSHSRSSISKVFRRAHDTLLFYSKGNVYTFNSQYRPLSEASMKLYTRKDKTGYHRLVPVLVSGAVQHGETGNSWRGIDPGKFGKNGMHWVTIPKNLEQYEKEGLLVWPKKTGGLPQLKYYLNQSKGVPVSDIWHDVGIIEAASNESLGYPTQKPEPLLERIIKASSNPTNLILDPFCGCGTAIAVAHKQNRRWIGIDVSPTACNLIAKRMLSIKSIRQKPMIMGMPMTEKELRKIQPFEFQNWVIQRLFGRVSTRKTSDMGIDGYTFEGHPVQVKQSGNVGRNVVDNFETAIRRRGTKKGVIVAFSFGKGSYKEVARAKIHDNLEIDLVKVSTLLENNQEQQNPSLGRL